jgi:hypothetical protein
MTSLGKYTTKSGEKWRASVRRYGISKTKSFDTRAEAKATEQYLLLNPQSGSRLARVNYWVEALGKKKLAALTTNDCQKALLALDTRKNRRRVGVMPATFNQYREVLIALLDWMVTQPGGRGIFHASQA